MLAASVYFVAEDRYVDFLPGGADQLIAVLRGASEIVSFYGKSFDIPVLRQHHGLEGDVPSDGVHTDMAEVISELMGYSLKLDDAAKKFLGERSPSLPEIRDALHMDQLRTVLTDGTHHVRGRAAGVECVTLRAISDTADEDLPLDFNALMTAEEKLSPLKLALAVLKAPQKIPALLRLGRNSATAAARLAEVLQRTLQGVP